MISGACPSVMAKHGPVPWCQELGAGICVLGFSRVTAASWLANIGP